MALTKCAARSGFEVALESLGLSPRFQRQNTLLASKGGVLRRGWKRLPDACALVHVIGSCSRCRNVPEYKSIRVCKRNASAFTGPPPSLSPLLRRDAFALWVGTDGEAQLKRGLPRCSPRGTSGRKRVTRLELATSSLARKCSTN
jgi:hypothetical protein